MSNIRSPDPPPAFSLNQLRLQVMSPAVQRENPFEIRLSGSNQFKL